MAKGGMQTIQDPLAAYKNWAANTTQGNYGNFVQPSLPGLQSYYGKNFGQTPQQTFSSLDPLSQDVYGAVQGDITGQGGPFTSLKNNLLGAFDTGAQKFTLDPLKEKLISEGIYSSGPGNDALSTAGTNLAQQRGVLSSDVDTQLLGMAQNLGNMVMNQNQLQGFTDPLSALQTLSGLIQPPQVQNIDNTVYQKPNTTAQMLGGLLPQVAGAELSMIPGGQIPGAILAGLSPSISGGGSPKQVFSPQNFGANLIPGYNAQTY